MYGRVLYVWVRSREIAAFQLPRAYNFEATPRFFEKLHTCSPILCTLLHLTSATLPYMMLCAKYTFGTPWVRRKGYSVSSGREFVNIVHKQTKKKVLYL